MGGVEFATWGHVALYAAGCAAIIVWCVGHLFKTMARSYDGIVGALQRQNAGQQNQIDGLRDRLNASDADCDKRIKELRASWQQTTDDVATVSQRVEKVEQKINGTH